MARLMLLTLVVILLGGAACAHLQRPAPREQRAESLDFKIQQDRFLASAPPSPSAASLTDRPPDGEAIRRLYRLIRLEKVGRERLERISALEAENLTLRQQLEEERAANARAVERFGEQSTPTPAQEAEELRRHAAALEEEKLQLMNELALLRQGPRREEEARQGKEPSTPQAGTAERMASRDRVDAQPASEMSSEDDDNGATAVRDPERDEETKKTTGDKKTTGGKKKKKKMKMAPPEPSGGLMEMVVNNAAALGAGAAVLAALAFFGFQFLRRRRGTDGGGND